MIRKIGNRKYDTDAGEPLGAWDNRRLDDDRFLSVERLMRKPRTGEHFLHCIGGKYSEHALPGPRAGESIIPLTEEEARRWAREKLPPARAAELFGDYGGDIVEVKAAVGASVAESLAAAAAERGLPLSEYAAEVLSSAARG